MCIYLYIHISTHTYGCIFPQQSMYISWENIKIPMPTIFFLKWKRTRQVFSHYNHYFLLLKKYLCCLNWLRKYLFHGFLICPLIVNYLLTTQKLLLAIKNIKHHVIHKHFTSDILIVTTYDILTFHISLK